VPFSIEAVSPEWAFIVISHVVSFVIDAFERVGAWQTLGGFEVRGV